MFNKLSGKFKIASKKITSLVMVATMSACVVTTTYQHSEGINVLANSDIATFALANVKVIDKGTSAAPTDSTLVRGETYTASVSLSKELDTPTFVAKVDNATETNFITVGKVETTEFDNTNTYTVEITVNKEIDFSTYGSSDEISFRVYATSGDTAEWSDFYKVNSVIDEVALERDDSTTDGYINSAVEVTATANSSGTELETDSVNTPIGTKIEYQWKTGESSNFPTLTNITGATNKEYTALVEDLAKHLYVTTIYTTYVYDSDNSAYTTVVEKKDTRTIYVGEVMNDLKVEDTTLAEVVSIIPITIGDSIELTASYGGADPSGTLKYEWKSDKLTVSPDPVSGDTRKAFFSLASGVIPTENITATVTLTADAKEYAKKSVVFQPISVFTNMEKEVDGIPYDSNVDGDIEVGLVAKTTATTTPATGTLSYTWKVGSSANATDLKEVGTGAEYTVGSLYVGQYLFVEATYTEVGGSTPPFETKLYPFGKIEVKSAVSSFIKVTDENGTEVLTNSPKVVYVGEEGKLTASYGTDAIFTWTSAYDSLVSLAGVIDSTQNADYVVSSPMNFGLNSYQDVTFNVQGKYTDEDKVEQTEDMTAKFRISSVYQDTLAVTTESDGIIKEGELIGVVATIKDGLGDTYTGTTEYKFMTGDSSTATTYSAPAGNETTPVTGKYTPDLSEVWKHLFVEVTYSNDVATIVEKRMYYLGQIYDNEPLGHLDIAIAKDGDAVGDSYDVVGHLGDEFTFLVTDSVSPTLGATYEYIWTKTGDINDSLKIEKTDVDGLEGTLSVTGVIKNITDTPIKVTVTKWETLNGVRRQIADTTIDFTIKTVYSDVKVSYDNGNEVAEDDIDTGDTLKAEATLVSEDYLVTDLSYTFKTGTSSDINGTLTQAGSGDEYTIKNSDAGKHLFVEVTYTDLDGNSEIIVHYVGPVKSATADGATGGISGVDLLLNDGSYTVGSEITIANSNFTATALPVIDGEFNTETATLTYSWKLGTSENATSLKDANGTPNTHTGVGSEEGYISSDYTVVEADAGRYLFVQIDYTATADGKTETYTKTYLVGKVEGVSEEREAITYYKIENGQYKDVTDFVIYAGKQFDLYVYPVFGDYDNSAYTWDILQTTGDIITIGDVSKEGSVGKSVSSVTEDFSTLIGKTARINTSYYVPANGEGSGNITGTSISVFDGVTMTRTGGNGDYEVGNAITVRAKSINGDDGDDLFASEESTLKFQWVVSDVNPSTSVASSVTYTNAGGSSNFYETVGNGSTWGDSTYTIATADVGKYLSVKITYNKRENSDHSSAVVGTESMIYTIGLMGTDDEIESSQALNITTSATVSLSKTTVEVGETVEATVMSKDTVIEGMDDEEDTVVPGENINNRVTFQWQRQLESGYWENMYGQTKSSYTPVSTETNGTEVRVIVSGNGEYYTIGSLTSTTATVTNASGGLGGGTGSDSDGFSPNYNFWNGAYGTGNYGESTFSSGFSSGTTPNAQINGTPVDTMMIAGISTLTVPMTNINSETGVEVSIPNLDKIDVLFSVTPSTGKVTIDTDFGTVSIPMTELYEDYGYGAKATLQLRKGSMMVNLLVNGNIINYSSPKNPITITLDYSLGQNQSPNALVMYENVGGREVIVPLSQYANKEIKGQVANTGTYDVKYNFKPFTDTINHWAAENINFISAREILTGVSDKTFDPDGYMTRGAFLTSLGKYEGIDTVNYMNSIYNDVNISAYYGPYISWATQIGIVYGVTGGDFGPDVPITREEVVLIMHSYMAYKGITVPTSTMYTEFADTATISDNAKGSVKYLQHAAIISGQDGNKFNPQGYITRAEIATIYRNFINAQLKI